MDDAAFARKMRARRGEVVEEAGAFWFAEPDMLAGSVTAILVSLDRRIKPGTIRDRLTHIFRVFRDRGVPAPCNAGLYASAIWLEWNEAPNRRLLMGALASDQAGGWAWVAREGGAVIKRWDRGPERVEKAARWLAGPLK